VTSFIDFWGSGNGHLRRMIPSARIICGVVIFASCLVLPVYKPLGFYIICGTTITWAFLCGIPWKNITGLLLYAFLLFLPLFLLTPWIERHPSSGYNWYDATKVPMEIGIRGTACIFICASTIAILDLSEFNTGLSLLPIPLTITSLVIQIVHQTAMLANESRRISSALRIRGVPSGYIARLRFLSALPTIWLLRIMNRAERIAAAMELRGFEITARTSNEPISVLDIFVVAAAILLLGTSITIRWLNVL